MQVRIYRAPALKVLSMSHFFTITLHHHISPADLARELFKCSKDAASLLVWILKIC